MEYKEDIEQLFKNTFDNFEADVNPDAWTNIQNGLNFQPASNTGSSGNQVSTGVKLAASSSKLSVISLIGTSAAIIGITAAVIYFSSGNESADADRSNELKTVQNTQPVSISANDENSNTLQAVNAGSEKHQASQVTSGETGNAQNNGNKTSPGSKEMSAYFSSTNEETAVSAMDKKNAEVIADTKNSNADIQQADNPVQTSSSPDNRSADDSNVKEEAKQNTDAVSAAPSETKEENNIEQFLGKIPNVITPNSDGDNDVFIIEGQNLKTLQVSILDRSGKIIHSWNNLHGFWDGKLNNGQPAKAGTYFYNIFARTITGKPLAKQGTIHLLVK